MALAFNRYFSRTRSFRVIALLSLAHFALGSHSALAQAVHGLTSVSEIRSLPSAKAAGEQPVRLRGVVTAVSGWRSSFFFQDSTSGISVDRSADLPKVEAGQLVEIVGVTSAGKFAPIVKANTVSVLGTDKMPRPRVVQPFQLADGSLDSQWATLQGVVRSAAIKPIWGHDVLVLEIDIGGGTLVMARVRNFSGDTWRRLPASVVSLHGVCGTVFNGRRQFVATSFFVSSLHDVKILRAAPKDLFDRPLIPLGSLAQFAAGRSAWDPVKIQGTVTSAQGDAAVYVQDGSDGVLVQTDNALALAPGTQVEVVGYSRNGDYSPSLQAAALRLLQPGHRSPLPTPVSASDVIVERDGFLAAPYDSLIVRLQGELMQVMPSPDGTTLFLRSGATVFTAKLPKSVTKGLPSVGSLVQVTGVCLTKVDPVTHEPKGFRLLLRSAKDVVVLQHGPWWTAENAKTVVIIMGLAMITMAVLLALYRRDTELRQLSYTDPLTSLYNRRGFVFLAEQQRRLALRNRTALLMFYIDVDRFKQINDLLGHKEGDFALQVVAGVLRECFRASDVIGRLGGDEFAIVACNAHSDSQAELTTRLTDLIAQRNRTLGAAFQLSLSVGTLRCDASQSHLSIDELLAHTDTLMYEQKSTSRSREIAFPPVPSAAQAV